MDRLNLSRQEDSETVNYSVYVDLSSDAGFSELFVENMILGEEI